MGTSSLILPAIFGDGICWIAKIGIDGILTDPRYSIKDTLEPAKWLKKRKEYKERIRAKYLHQLDKKQRAYSNSTDLAIAEDEPDPKNDMLQVFINEVKNMEFLRPCAVKVPKAYGKPFAISAQSKRSACILMEMIHGVSGLEFLTHSKEPEAREHKQNMLRSLARIQVSLAECTNPTTCLIGNRERRKGTHNDVDIFFQAKCIRKKKEAAKLDGVNGKIAKNRLYRYVDVFLKARSFIREESGPFQLTSLDFGPHNIICNERGELMTVIDLDGLIFAPIGYAAQLPHNCDLESFYTDLRDVSTGIRENWSNEDVGLYLQYLEQEGPLGRKLANAANSPSVLITAGLQRHLEVGEEFDGWEKVAEAAVLRIENMPPSVEQPSDGHTSEKGDTEAPVIPSPSSAGSHSATSQNEAADPQRKSCIKKQLTRRLKKAFSILTPPYRRRSQRQE